MSQSMPSQTAIRERIIRSLFSEKDDTGTMLEQYITHVKILEDVQYPSEPPPEPTARENLKERFLLLSVKKNGRVRMHKSRDNENGRFQIGKTWNLEDLQSIMEVDKRGMVVTLLKPYYWTMESSKEKYMFVNALIKVYKKYTGGRMFDLQGFDPQHLPATERTSISAGRTEQRSVSAQSTSERPIQSTNQARTQRSVSELREAQVRDPQRQVPPPSQLSATSPISQIAPTPVQPGFIRSQRSLSELQNGQGRDPQRQHASSSGISRNSPNLPSYVPSNTLDSLSRQLTPQHNGQTTSRSVSSQSGPPVNHFPSIATQSRSFSGPSDDKHRRGAVPFASPPIQDTASRQTPASSFGRVINTSSNQTTIETNSRSIRAMDGALGSPLSFRERPNPASPSLEAPPEKSLLRQSTVSPSIELAPALRSHENPPRTPMSPPPPAKSPARRPSTVRTSSHEPSKAAYERLNGLVSPTDSILPSPVSGLSLIPSVPVKSGARSSEVARTGERSGVPWQSPREDSVEQDYFTTNGAQPTKHGLVVEPVVTDERTTELLLSPTSPTLVTAEDAGPVMLDEASTDEDRAYVDDIVRDFKWTAQHGAFQLANQLQNELAGLEAASIYAIVENDGRVEDLMKRLDDAIAQCEDMDNLLTIYEFELATVSDNIKHIEGQNQGLQVQTANQNALVAEISRVLTSITISETDLDVLKGRGGNLESLDGVQNIERSLINLYRALKSMRDEKSNALGHGMSATHSKNKDYLQESRAFLSRLGKYLDIKFQAALITSEPQSVSRSEPPAVLPGHENGFMSLVPYASLMLYSREIQPDMLVDYMKSYAAAAKSAWQEAIENFAGHWRSYVGKNMTGESDMVFMATRDLQSQSATRNAALKRSNTLAKQIRSVTTTTKVDKDTVDAKPPASDVFRTILDNVALVLANEQNFLVSFFHMSSFNSYEFSDYVELEVKSRITIASLDDHKPTEPNRSLAKERYSLMESIFGWLLNDLIVSVEHLAKLDPFQIIGMIKSIEVVIIEWSDSDQEFMLRTLAKLKEKSIISFGRFIDMQLKAIKDLKVTSKKRKGVIPVFEIFPDFVERTEIQLQTTDSEQVNTNQLEIRRNVNDAYEKMSKAMFDSVRTMASSTTITSQSTDPEDKEVLNYHILMVQNMHQYLEALQSRNNRTLEDFQASAQKQYYEHLKLYTRQIITRAIGRLLDFTDTLDKSARQDDDITNKAVFSQTSVKRLLADHDERDMRKGISAIWKRVDKHFGDDDAPAAGLLSIVWKATQQEYLSVIDHLLEIIQKHYPDIRPDWSRDALLGAFAKREA